MSMPFTAQFTLETIARLLGLLALIQSIEFLQKTAETSDQGIWRWSDIERELGFLFKIFLSENGFFILNIVRALCAVLTIFAPHPVGLFLLMIAHILTLLRWLGVFNGGSDYMNLLLLIFTLIGLWAGGSVAVACLYYVSLQLCLSYFRAGWLKLRSASWRNGESLARFVNAPIYEPVHWLRIFTTNRSRIRIAAWIVILFEVTFPLSLLDMRLALLYMLTGASFHLFNSYALGLNRFFFAWIAAYPALYWCSSH